MTEKKRRFFYAETLVIILLMNNKLNWVLFRLNIMNSIFVYRIFDIIRLKMLNYVRRKMDNVSTNGRRNC
jgi:hypothetical protein